MISPPGTLGRRRGPGEITPYSSVSRRVGIIRRGGGGRGDLTSTAAYLAKRHNGTDWSRKLPSEQHQEIQDKRARGSITYRYKSLNTVKSEKRRILLLKRYFEAQKLNKN